MGGTQPLSYLWPPTLTHLFYPTQPQPPLDVGWSLLIQACTLHTASPVKLPGGPISTVAGLSASIPPQAGWWRCSFPPMPYWLTWHSIMSPPLRQLHPQSRDFDDCFMLYTTGPEQHVGRVAHYQMPQAWFSPAGSWLCTQGSLPVGWRTRTCWNPGLSVGAEKCFPCCIMSHPATFLLVSFGPLVALPSISFIL